MKKTILSLIAFALVATSSLAQANTDKIKAETVRAAARLNQAGVQSGTIQFGYDPANFQVTKPAVVPAKSSKPASSATGGTAQRSTTSAPAKPKGAPTTTVGGIEYFVTPFGIKLKGDTAVTDDGYVLVVDDFGNLQWTGSMIQQAPVQQLPEKKAVAPDPNNNTGVAVAQTTTPQAATQSMAMIVPPGAQALVQGDDWKMIGGEGVAGGASGGSNSGGSNEDPLLTKKLTPNEIVYDRQGNMVRESTSIKKLQIRRGYDSEGNPTDATVAWMNNRNGGGGLARVAAVTGMSVNSYPVIYNQGPVATYGPVGYNGWAQQQFWNQNCFGCR